MLFNNIEIILCNCTCSLTPDIRRNVLEMGRLLGRVSSSGATRLQTSQRSSITKDSDVVLKPLIESLEHKSDIY